MKFSISSLLVFVAVFFTASCKKMPNDGVPFYLQIDTATVRIDNPSFGANTHNITDVWVEANTDNLGAYKIPCNFPVLQENATRFTLSAGISESGQSGVRVIYPFYTVDTFTINASRGEQYSHVPVFKYLPGTKFPTKFPPEDFELGNDFNSLTLVDDTNARYGNRCGAITVSTTTDSNITASQINKYDLPEGQEIWLEVDYKSEVPFYIGFFGNYLSGEVLRTPVVFVTAKPYWNKIYVKLSNYVGVVRADTYNIYFEALRPIDSNGGTVFIDNVKLVHF